MKSMSNVLARKDVLDQPRQTSKRRLESCRANPMSKQLWGQSQHSNTGSCFLSVLESTQRAHGPPKLGMEGPRRLKYADSAIWVSSEPCWWLWVKMPTGTNVEVIYHLWFGAFRHSDLLTSWNISRQGGVLVHFVLLQQEYSRRGVA